MSEVEIVRHRQMDGLSRFINTVDRNVKKLRFVPLKTNGCEEFRLFGFEAR